MAKDVDLSSKEWLEIVFDGKNKEYGAYELRSTSTARHNKSVIIVLIGLAILLGVLIAVMTGVFERAEDDGADASVAQEDITLYNPEEEEVQDDPEQIEIPEEKIEMPKEEVANQIQNTIIDVVKDEEVVNAVKNQQDLKEDNRQMGVQDISDGIDDLTKKVVKEEVIVVEEKPKEDNIVYTTANVQQQPVFPGGEDALYKWLNDHVQYPAQAAEEGVSGRVIVEFVISKSGAVENVKIARGRHPALDKEALRVVKSMPKWNPGRNNGQAVKVTFHLPVTFRLQK